ncbi:hypothetical protein [Cyclobacterium qasimii]|nr:hypothetical protein [Cyclobacterium qasimii]EPR68180.1 hypothetical protein ADICYQ_2900 [Cyclobacterium qasimii M12-11B]
MSNLSAIGFDIDSEEEFYILAKKAYAKASSIKTDKGTYFQYSDPSGAELWIQSNTKHELIGVNPYYKGISKRTVCLIANIDREISALDGAFHSWADPTEPGNPESGAYPFVFDVPNHKSLGSIKFPQSIEIQLSAFAQDIDYYENEKAFEQGQEGEQKWAAQSFVPSGLFSSNANLDLSLAVAAGLISGTIKESDKKRNDLTGQEFQWMLVDTLGGEIDVVADLELFSTDPQVGGLIQGQFWLTGQLLKLPELV